MPRPPLDLARKIKDILTHVLPLPDEAKAPILHYRRTGTDIWNSLAYVERSVSESGRYQTVVSRHFGRLYGMALIQLVENFERFLKEVAAECVDCLANFVVDDRFNVFTIQGSSLASHFATGTLGKSLCESSTWLDCEEINKRFRKLLSAPFQVGGHSFDLFPKPSQQPEADRWRFEPMDLIWQMRNASVHNVGVITQSDAMKLQLWAREKVSSHCILNPTRSDIDYLKRFLDDTTNRCNQRIGERLVELLTEIQAQTPTLMNPQELANRVSSAFRVSLSVAGIAGVVPPES